MLLLLPQVPASDTDVNVISWNRLVGYMLASGVQVGSTLDLCCRICDITGYTLSWLESVAA